MAKEMESLQIIQPILPPLNPPTWDVTQLSHTPGVILLNREDWKRCDIPNGVHPAVPENKDRTKKWLLDGMENDQASGIFLH